MKDACRGGVKTPFFVFPSTRSTQHHHDCRAAIFRVVSISVPCTWIRPVGGLLILEAVVVCNLLSDMHLTANTQFNSRE